jgi:hypothetical protein
MYQLQVGASSVIIPILVLNLLMENCAFSAISPSWATSSNFDGPLLGITASDLVGGVDRRGQLPFIFFFTRDVTGLDPQPLPAFCRAVSAMALTDSNSLLHFV